MAVQRKGWEDQLMMSLFEKETTFDAGVTMDDTNACSMESFELQVSPAHRVEDDSDSVTGSEYAKTQEILQKAYDFTYTENRAKPNTLAGLGALVMGAITSTPGAGTDYKHTITPVAAGTALPSGQLEHKRGGVQYAYNGVKGGSLEISAEEGGPAKAVSDLQGSGTRAGSATAFASKISESWLLVKQCKVWMEDGSDITITSPLTQEAQDISGATPEDIGARLKSFRWKFMNNLERQVGFGSEVSQDIDSLRRAVELSFDLRFVDDTELNHFLNQDPLAIEFDLAGALIDVAGTYKFGVQIVVPKFQLKEEPLPQGGPGDSLVVTMTPTVMDDGTNPISILEVYNAVAAYAA